MALCVHCQKRKAKRRCPALGSELCPLCCGLMRDRELRCPPSCPHLARHRPYQERKIIDRKASRPGGAPRDERLDWLLLNIEALLDRLAAVRPGFTDRDAVLALEAARDKLGRARPLLLVTEPPGRLADEPGEIVFKGIESCRYEGKIVLPQTLQAYKLEEKQAALEDLLGAIKAFSGGDLGGRRYLDDLARRFAASRGAPPQGQRIIPVR